MKGSLIAGCVLSVLVASCGTPPDVRPSGAAGSNSLFAVTVQLTPEAERRLLELRETTVVIAYFEGQPRPSVEDRELNSEGIIELGSTRVEMDGAGTVRLGVIPLSPRQKVLLATEDYAVLVNVTSGRRTDEKNLLNCGSILEKKNQLLGGHRTVVCSLIRE
jgi:hypothetical protein